MKILKTITALLICCSTVGQGKTFYNVTKRNGDTTFWFKYVTERAKKLSLPLLETASKFEYVRIWTDRQVIDIWQGENDNPSGKLITWTDEFVGGNEEPTNRTFIKTKPLSSDTVSLLKELLTSSKILILPTDDSIKGWQQGFDGITYITERSTKDSYSFKSYWTPKAQDSLKEALQVQAFVDSAFSLANAHAVLRQFVKEIPFESYYNGGPGVAIRILTKKERKKYRRERQNYRQQELGKSRATGH